MLGGRSGGERSARARSGGGGPVEGGGAGGSFPCVFFFLFHFFFSFSPFSLGQKLSVAKAARLGAGHKRCAKSGLRQKRSGPKAVYLGQKRCGPKAGSSADVIVLHLIVKWQAYLGWWLGKSFRPQWRMCCSLCVVFGVQGVQGFRGWGLGSFFVLGV